MGILTNLISKRSLQVAHPKDPVLARYFGASDGELNITPDVAMQSTAVWSCIKVLSETIASLPFHLMKETAGGTKKAENHYLYKILHDQPNQYQTAFEFYEMMVAHKALRGNAYAEKIYNNNGELSQLIPLHPDYIRPFLTNGGKVAYYYTPVNGQSRVIFDSEIMHWKGLSFDGVVGLNPIEYHRYAVGIALYADKYGERFFANDATPGGILTMPAHFKTKEDKAKFLSAWQEAQTGSNRRKTALLEHDIKYTPISLNNEDAQFLQTRKYQKSDIASIFRIPPHMIGDLERSTNNNIEHQGIEFVVHTIRPWVVSIEQSIKRDLFTSSMNSFYLIINVDGLLRGDSASRAAYYREQWNIGAITQNEIRALENRNPYEDPAADKAFVPMNMSPIDKPTEDLTNNDEPNLKLDKIVESNSIRLRTKEINAIRKSIKSLDTFDSLAEDFYRKHAVILSESLAINIDEAAQYCERSRLRLTELVKSNNFSGLTKWEEDRLDEILNLAKKGL